MLNELEIEVRSTELDTLGHVNNAKYLEYLEWGRFAWVAEAGVPLDALARDGLGTAIVHVDISFRREARLGERLTIRTRLAGMGTSSFRIGQDVVNASGETVAEAVVTSVMFDTRARRAAPIPPGLRARMEGLVRDEG